MLKSTDFNQEVLTLFDAYVHGSIDRRTFLTRAAKFAVGTMTAAAILDTLNPNFAAAQLIKPDDPRLRSEHVAYPSPQGYAKTQAYVVQPTGEAKRPGILVVHENRGLNPHIEDITRRLALEGYLALAPDALAPLGGYPGDEDKARELFATLDQAKTRQDMLAAAKYLKQRPDCTGKIGVVGFCWGGGITLFLATQLPDLNAAVAFYGNQPPADQAANVKCPLMMHYAANDPRINAGRSAWEDALKAAHVQYSSYTYPGTQHGFNNNTTPRYDEPAAKLAWTRTLDFFNQHLRG
jgi:carboxymethylenebutenolidase